MSWPILLKIQNNRPSDDMAGYSFLLLVIVSNILTSGSFWPMINISAALIHESGHLLAMMFLGMPITKLRFCGWGLRIKQNTVVSYRQELAVAMAGPLINVIVGAVLSLILFWIDSAILRIFALSNFLYALLNVLPIPPLDGDKIFGKILCLYFECDTVRKIQKSIYFLFLIITVFVFLLLFWLKFYNFSLFCILLLLSSNLIISILR